MDLIDKHIDTITLGGMVNIDRLGKLYHKTTSWHQRNKPVFDIDVRDNNKTALLIHKQDWGGNARIHTTQEFMNDYGYNLTIHIPKRVEYLMKTAQGNRITDKQQRMLDKCGYRLVVEIPSLKRLLASEYFETFMVGSARDNLLLSDLVWDYIQHYHNFIDFGIGGYDNQSYMKTGEQVDKDYLHLSRIDFAYDITGVSSVETLDLVRRYGYISWNKITEYHNDYALNEDTSTLLNTPNGIEYRRGKNSSEIYKFYDKVLADRNYLHTHQLLYTSADTRRAYEVSKNKIDDNINKVLRYEVSIYNKTGANRRIDKVYERATNENKKINLFDILDNKVYEEIPAYTLRDGLTKIFGSSVSKPITENIGDAPTMKDKDIIKEFGSKGLKFLGIKHLIDKNMSQDKVRNFLVKECGMNYETTRRLFYDIQKANIMDKWKDTHIQSMDALRRVYHGLS